MTTEGRVEEIRCAVNEYLNQIVGSAVAAKEFTEVEHPRTGEEQALTIEGVREVKKRSAELKAEIRLLDEWLRHATNVLREGR